MTAARVEVLDTVESDADTEVLAALVRTVLAAEAASVAISVALVDDPTIRALHREFQDQDSATDVLSFPLHDAEDEGPDVFDPDAEGPGGEVVVSVDTARREAAARGVPFEAELSLYVIHGVLHIIGYDDLDDAARARMRAAEARHLAAAGYPADLFTTTPCGDVEKSEQMRTDATRKDEGS